MTAPLLDARDLDFLLYEVFDAEALIGRERYAEHSRETFSAALDTARTVAEKHFLPLRKTLDKHPPEFVDGRAVLIPEAKPAVDAAIAAGLTRARCDFDVDGMQLPSIVANAVHAYLQAASAPLLAYTGLTEGNANLIDAFGSKEQKATWVLPMREGRFTGTMALTEPAAGSGLADITTSATPADDGTYRIRGSKIFISGGDHNLSENIVHLVLARVKGAPKGTKGISLFIVPKYLLNADGSIGEHNDVALAGLFHKMGWNGTTSTALNFGERDGAVGYLVGEENRGLSYMFQMMNEARIMVGTGAAVTALVGYQYSLDYARERPQGRLPSSKDPLSPPVNIIEHADVRRMLLAQKALAEGAYCLCLYGAQLADDERTAPDAEQRRAAAELLDLLTPIIKTWPSENGPIANSLAIQVLGGHGYIDEHPVEMFYRDNRLNPIHEGTTGIQSLDLLARKVPMKDMAGYRALQEEILNACDSAKQYPILAEYAAELHEALKILDTTTHTLLKAMAEKNIDLALANSVCYLELFGHVVVAWQWLKQGIAAAQGLERKPHEREVNFYHGKLQALRYFYRVELVKIAAWSSLLTSLDSTSFDMQAEWY